VEDSSIFRHTDVADQGFRVSLPKTASVRGMGELMGRGLPSSAQRTDQPAAITRVQFLRGALVTGGAVLLGGIPLLSGAPRIAHALRSPQMDVKILNFALLLEYLEDAFYADALERNALSGELLRFAEEVSRHEAAHVRILRDVLGDKARPRPNFDFGGVTSDPQQFSSAAALIEETGSAAYIGQGANLSSGMVASAGRIASVEARHTAWIRSIVGRNPAPNAADPAMSEQEVTEAIQSTGFVS
jgi:hypothetical protein